MILALLLQATLDGLPRQALPANGCAAYLWNVDAPRRLVAMAEPARLRIALDGKPVELARTGGEGPVTLGMAATMRYAATGIEATLDLTVAERADIAQGGLVSQATLTVAPAGKDMIVMPVGGMVGCG